MKDTGMCGDIVRHLLLSVKLSPGSPRLKWYFSRENAIAENSNKKIRGKVLIMSLVIVRADLHGTTL